MSLVSRINLLLHRIESMLPVLFGRFPPPDPILLMNVETESSLRPSQFTIKDIIGDGFLWAVPKHRRTIEKRLKRKFGSPQYTMKILLPKTHLRVCNSCGNHYEVGLLCPTCYEKTRKETELMQEKIQQELKLSPVENEVVVLYDGEKGEHPSEFWKGKRIVEMEKPRPKWFSKNLMQKTTQPLATTTDVKPDELG